MNLRYCLVISSAVLGILSTPALATEMSNDTPPVPLAPGEQPEAPTVLNTPTANPDASTIAVIESRHINAAHDMDLEWSNVAITMGHAPTILPQFALDTYSSFSSYDALIVSSGVAIYSPTQVANIVTYIQSGRSVYMQGEYQCSQPGTVCFEDILTGLGMSWSCDGESIGDLQPMPVVGYLSTTPNTVTPLSYYWYGCYGTGNATFEPFLVKNGLNYGFTVKPANPGYGWIIFDTDQDWVRVTTSPALMENIITCLLECQAGGCPEDLDNSGAVDFGDILRILSNWGPCP